MLRGTTDRKTPPNRVENPRVDGSIPPLATNEIKQLSPVPVMGLLFFESVQVVQERKGR
jgi:hypothetical protein